jgi:transcriptional regulator with XRE-family HTH domain
MLVRLRLGGRIRELRRRRGLTLQTVSDGCGLSVAHLSQVELGRRLPPRPSHSAYGPIAKLLDVPERSLRRDAVRERLPMAERVFDVEGTPWLKRRR